MVGPAGFGQVTGSLDGDRISPAGDPGVWSPTCGRSYGATKAPACANGTAVAVLLSSCPHLSLDQAPRDMPLFGVLSASVLMVLGVCCNLAVLIILSRRHRRRLRLTLSEARSASSSSSARNAAHPLHFLVLLALGDLLGCLVIFISQIAYTIFSSSSVPDYHVPVLYMVFMVGITWSGLMESAIIGLIAVRRIHAAVRPLRDVNALPKGCLLAIVFGVVFAGTLVVPAAGLWCDLQQWHFLDRWPCVTCRNIFLQCLNCKTAMFVYCIVMLTVILSSCVTFAVFAVVRIQHAQTRKPVSVSSSTSSTYVPPERFGIAMVDTVLTTICWTPLLIQFLIDQEVSYTTYSHGSTCTMDSTFLQIAILPMVLHPIAFLVGSDELAAFFHSHGGDRRREPPRGDVFDSAFVEEPSSRIAFTRSMASEQDPMLSFSGRRPSVKRNVCFELEKSNRSRFFLTDFWSKSKTPKRKPTRYWKRYSCSSAEPMSLFSSSSSSSINHIHQLSAGPLPDAVYKRERIARRSSAFKSSSNVSSNTPTYSSGRERECTTANVMLLTETQSDNGRRRCSF